MTHQIVNGQIKYIYLFEDRGKHKPARNAELGPMPQVKLYETTDYERLGLSTKDLDMVKYLAVDSFEDAVSLRLRGILTDASFKAYMEDNASTDTTAI